LSSHGSGATAVPAEAQAATAATAERGVRRYRGVLLFGRQDLRVVPPLMALAPGLEPSSRILPVFLRIGFGFVVVARRKSHHQMVVPIQLVPIGGGGGGGSRSRCTTPLVSKGGMIRRGLVAIIVGVLCGNQTQEAMIVDSIEKGVGFSVVLVQDAGGPGGAGKTGSAATVAPAVDKTVVSKLVVMVAVEVTVEVVVVVVVVPVAEVVAFTRRRATGR